MKVKDKVCVVTGAAGGIGEAIARRYAKEGAKGVVVADMDAGRLEDVAKRHQGRRRGLRRRQGSRLRHLIAEAERHYGPVDVFFSNAGIGRGGHEDATDKDWADSAGRSMSWRMSMPRARWCRACWQRKSGYLLNTASAAGLLASMGSAPYGVTKHAARGAGRASVDPVRRQGHLRLGALPAGGRHQHAAHGRRHRGVGRRRDQHRRGGADRDRGDGCRDLPDPAASRGEGVHGAQDPTATAGCAACAACATRRARGRGGAREQKHRTLARSQEPLLVPRQGPGLCAGAGARRDSAPAPL